MRKIQDIWIDWGPLTLVVGMFGLFYFWGRENRHVLSLPPDTGVHRARVVCQIVEVDGKLFVYRDNSLRPLRTPIDTTTTR